MLVTMQDQGDPMGKLTSTVLAVILLAAAAWWILHEPSLADNEIRITYLDEKTCVLKDWSFKIRKRASIHNMVNGGMLQMGRPKSPWQTVEDTDLHIYSPMGEELHIPRSKLRQIVFESQSHPDIGNDKRTVRITVTTTDDIFSFDATELPNFSRTRLLVPVASYYFPNEGDDAVRKGNIILTIDGTPEDDSCPNRDVSLTRTDHPANRTPVRIEFPN